MSHTVKGFSIVNEADVFLELPCFLHNPTNIGNFSLLPLLLWNSTFRSYIFLFLLCFLLLFFSQLFVKPPQTVILLFADRMWSTGEGNGKPLQYSCLENPMNSMKRQNERGTPQVSRCPICYWRSVEK